MSTKWDSLNTDIIGDLERATEEAKKTGIQPNLMRFPNEEYRDEFIKSYCRLCANGHGIQPEKCPHEICSFYEHNPYIEKTTQCEKI